MDPPLMVATITPPSSSAPKKTGEAAVATTMMA